MLPFSFMLTFENTNELLKLATQTMNIELQGKKEDQDVEILNHFRDIHISLHYIRIKLNQNGNQKKRA